MTDGAHQQWHTGDTLHWKRKKRRQRQKLALRRRLQATHGVTECLVLLPTSSPLTDNNCCNFHKTTVQSGKPSRCVASHLCQLSLLSSVGR